jgi:hypothetical protein
MNRVFIAIMALLSTASLVGARNQTNDSTLLVEVPTSFVIQASGFSNSSTNGNILCGNGNTGTLSLFPSIPDELVTWSCTSGVTVTEIGNGQITISKNTGLSVSCSTQTVYYSIQTPGCGPILGSFTFIIGGNIELSSENHNTNGFDECSNITLCSNSTDASVFVSLNPIGDSDGSVDSWTTLVTYTNPNIPPTLTVNGFSASGSNEFDYSLPSGNSNTVSSVVVTAKMSNCCNASEKNFYINYSSASGCTSSCHSN